MGRVSVALQPGMSWGVCVVFPGITVQCRSGNLFKFTGHLKLAVLSTGTPSLFPQKVLDTFAVFTVAFHTTDTPVMITKLLPYCTGLTKIQMLSLLSGKPDFSEVL